jgi:hypothetical protein
MLEAKLLAFKKPQQQFNDKVKEWDQKMMTMKQDIVDSTVKGTMTLLTSTTTPFGTKKDNIRLQEQTNRVIHAAVITTNTEIASLNDGILALLQRTNHLFVTIHDPDKTSLTRKTQSTMEPRKEPDPTTPVRLFNAADTAMETMDGVSED